MDVKYIPSDWEKMRDGIGDLIGLWRWGKGMIDNLKDISENLEDAKSDIADYDHDGVISFQYTSLENKYQNLYEDFDVLHSFAGKVGGIVDRTIDQPFYEDMDAFVEAMRDLTISNYTTKNRIGATETQIIYDGGYGPYQSMEVPKTEVSLDDLFSSSDFYGEQMKLEYEEWKKLNPDKDISQEQYQQAALNTRAFEYESIRNQQENKEFWVQLGALVVIVGVSIVCPPAGMALGVAYGTLELSSAVSGKDWVSGRELGTGERWFRGLLAPLDIIPGVGALKKLSGTARLTHIGKDTALISMKTGVKSSFQKGMTKVNNLVKTAEQFAVTRLKSAGAVIKDVSNLVIKKLAKDTIEVGWVVDSAVTFGKNMIPSKKRLVVTDTGERYYLRVDNTHTVENKLRDFINRMEVNLNGGPRGTGSGSSSTSISSDMKAKILEGQRKAQRNIIIGGHSPSINNDNVDFAVEVLSTNADGTKNVVFTKQFPDGNISRLKKSTLFPDSWSDDQIIKSIIDVGETPAISTRLRDEATWHRATINGVEIDVIKMGDDVTSGYPTGKVNAPHPSGY
ncbi:EndoU domain-containing protein [Neobacillus vireti]|uniref:EndoU domain-containing protein n=1 Tax=Neobacillus vireti TaxID=220686 RepID=UPI002FFF9547